MAEKASELKTRDEKIAQAKELYSRGSRNFLVKSYEEAADDLSNVCSLYSELYGELSNELGMPYLLYAKSLIALALEENKVLDVPDEEDEDGDEDDDGEENESEMKTDAEKLNDDKKTVKDDKKNENDEKMDVESADEKKNEEENKKKESKNKEVEDDVKMSVTKANGEEKESSKTEKIDASKTEKQSTENGANLEVQPGTSNGAVEEEDTTKDDEEGDEAATNLQVAWETLELAAKIFKNQGESALPNLAEVYTELANIEFENNIMQSAREDYNKALEIYKELSSNYRRPMAEIYYKIGLSYLMEQASKESAEFLKEACNILGEEIDEMKNKKNPTEKDKLNLQDMEETKQEIWAKIVEIEESMQQCIAEVRAAIQNHMNPTPNSKFGEGTSSSSSSSSAAASASGSSSSSSTEKSKPTDISHLIKRKKPDTVDVEMSPAKRPAT